MDKEVLIADPEQRASASRGGQPSGDDGAIGPPNADPEDSRSRPSVALNRFGGGGRHAALCDVTAATRASSLPLQARVDPEQKLSGSFSQPVTRLLVRENPGVSPGSSCGSSATPSRQEELPHPVGAPAAASGVGPRRRLRLAARGRSQRQPALRWSALMLPDCDPGAAPSVLTASTATRAIPRPTDSAASADGRAIAVRPQRHC